MLNVYFGSVVINVHAWSKLLKMVVAQGDYVAYVKANFPRDRYVGFQFPLPKSVTGDDVIDVYVESTGQKLNFKPLTVKKGKV